MSAATVSVLVASACTESGPPRNLPSDATIDRNNDRDSLPPPSPSPMSDGAREPVVSADAAPVADVASPADRNPGTTPDRSIPTDISASDAGTAPDAAAGFAPCPPAEPCRIMPLGDSITHGIGSTYGAGYRLPLFQRTLAARRAITFVGSDQNGPTMVDGVPFPQQHEGHRMFIIDTVGTRAGLIPLINTAVTTHKPHIVTLMIGTNDAGSSAYASEAPRRMGELLDRIHAAAPNALIVVAKIVPTTSDARNQAVVSFNNALPAVVSARTATRRAILLVDMYQPFVSQADFKTSLMADSLHPNDAGFLKMAEVWWNAVQPYLRAPTAN